MLKNNEYFERVIRSKKCHYKKNSHDWVRTEILKSDFLRSLDFLIPQISVKSIASSKYEISLDLLAIYVDKNSEYCVNGFFSNQKLLAHISNEDIIEVFI